MRYLFLLLVLLVGCGKKIKEGDCVYSKIDPHPGRVVMVDGPRVFWESGGNGYISDEGAAIKLPDHWCK